MAYQVGDKVRWKNVALDKTQQAATGVVIFVSPSNTNNDDVAVYDVKFDFGEFRLYGVQLEPWEQKALPFQ